MNGINSMAGVASAARRKAGKSRNGGMAAWRQNMANNGRRRHGVAKASAGGMAWQITVASRQQHEKQA